jgi:hypothetical protein
VSRHDLPAYLHEKLQEQARIDQAFEKRVLKDISSAAAGNPSDATSHEHPLLPSPADFHLVPYHESQKRAKTRQIVWDKGLID